MVKQGRAARRPTNRAGTVTIDGKEHAVLLRDLSATGARLRLAAAGALPDRFRLVAPLEKVNAECVVVWRRGVDCGVRFE
ncbi:MAG: PilZ domain-containing protein [Hyphomicrobium sp.]|uniref:PilZ domain-containing protein n=1 Tax=Hyphomicrobium sp. TaxID=82 RepID=UPI003D1083A7